MPVSMCMAGSKSPQAPRHTPWGPSRALPQRLPQPLTSLPITPTAAALQTGQGLKPAAKPTAPTALQTQAGRAAAQPALGLDTCRPGALRSPQLALGSGLRLQGSLPQCCHPGLLDAAPWGLPQPRDMVQPGEALGHTANPEPLRLQTLLVPGHCQGSPKDETRYPPHSCLASGLSFWGAPRPRPALPQNPGPIARSGWRPRLQAPSGRSRSSG